MEKKIEDFNIEILQKQRAHLVKQRDRLSHDIREIDLHIKLEMSKLESQLLTNYKEK